MCEITTIKKPELDCIAEEVFKLDSIKKFNTILSCCGHGVYPKTIMIKNIRSCWYFEYYSGVSMMTNLDKPYYQKDILGFWYNEEVMKYYNKHPEKRRAMKVGILFEKEGNLLNFEPLKPIEHDLIIKKHVIINSNVIR